MTEPALSEIELLVLGAVAGGLWVIAIPMGVLSGSRAALQIR
ncbi:MAG: hypothetical protein ACI9OJ_005906 [Myxococcota bacterium]|jgi:hypothetical protein